MGTDDDRRDSPDKDEGLGWAYAPPGRGPRITDNLSILVAVAVVVVAVVVVAVLLAVG